MAKKATSITTKARKTSAKKTSFKTPIKSGKTASQVQKFAVARRSSTKASVKGTADKLESQQLQPTSLKIRKIHLMIALVIIALGALLFLARGVFVAATVNGELIPRLAVVREAEKQSGKQALDTLIRNALIEQEARKENVTVSDKEIDDEIKKIEGTLSKQGQKLDQVLTMQNMTKDDLRRLVRLDKLVGKMAGKDVKVTDKEVADYIEKNKAMLPTNQSEADLKKSVQDRLKQQKLNQKVQSWLQGLQTKASIIYFVQY